mmetsp:Transcript_114349/g.198850  ORF Transcript_114349/g.198850 Transcript_114349/m.198850 type:complete len:225 (-) Transcript_114349:72-746(-)
MLVLDLICPFVPSVDIVETFVITCARCKIPHGSSQSVLSSIYHSKYCIFLHFPSHFNERLPCVFALITPRVAHEHHDHVFFVEHLLQLFCRQLLDRGSVKHSITVVIVVINLFCHFPINGHILSEGFWVLHQLIKVVLLTLLKEYTLFAFSFTFTFAPTSVDIFSEHKLKLVSALGCVALEVELIITEVELTVLGALDVDGQKYFRLVLTPLELWYVYGQSSRG